MSDRKRAIGVAIGAMVLAMWATTFDAGASDTGCRGLSPASAEGCTADELRAALDR